MTPLVASLADIAPRYGAVFCDLWGCLHNGVAAYPAAVAALQGFRAAGGRVILDRKASLMATMPGVAAEDGAEQVLLFVIDILREEATLLVPNDLVKRVAEASFGVAVTGDTVVLPGILSRKKQIIPALKL